MAEAYLRDYEWYINDTRGAIRPVFEVLPEWPLFSIMQKFLQIWPPEVKECFLKKIGKFHFTKIERIFFDNLFKQVSIINL